MGDFDIWRYDSFGMRNTMDASRFSKRGRKYTANRWAAQGSNRKRVRNTKGRKPQSHF